MSLSKEKRKEILPWVKKSARNYERYVAVETRVRTYARPKPKPRQRRQPDQ